MTLTKWQESVKIAKIKLKIDPKSFVKVQGELLREAQKIYAILLIKR
jgi:hypothetical protein